MTKRKTIGYLLIVVAIAVCCLGMVFAIPTADSSAEASSTISLSVDADYFYYMESTTESTEIPASLTAQVMFGYGFWMSGNTTYFQLNVHNESENYATYEHCFTFFNEYYPDYWMAVNNLSCDEWNVDYKNGFTGSSLSLNIVDKITITYHDANKGSSETRYTGNGCGFYVLDSSFAYKKDYSFIEWNSKDDGTGTKYETNNHKTNVTSDLDIYAVWGGKITYHKNPPASATGVSDSTTTGSAIKSGSNDTLKASNTFSIPNYTFLGWDTDKNATTPTYSAGASYPITQNVDLYGIWEKQGLSVTYDYNVEESLKSTVSGDLPKDDTLYEQGKDGQTHTVQAATLTRPGYKFLGWAQDEKLSATPNVTTGQSVTVKDNNVTFYAVWEKLFTVNDGGDTIVSYLGTDTAVVIPEKIDNKSITKIADSAFKDKTTITSVTLSKSVVSIGEKAFSGCSSLTTFTFATSGSLTTIGASAFYQAGITSITLPSTITSLGNFLFQNSKLQSVAFESGYTYNTIPNYMFYGTKLTSFTVPNYIETIGDNAFDCCTSLATLTFESDGVLKTIGEYAFCSCKLAAVTVPKSVTGLGLGCFSDNSFLASVSFETGCNVTAIPVYFVSVGALYPDAPQCTITLYEGITTIGAQAFANKNIQEITLPASLTTINSTVFLGCKNLETVTFADDSQLKTLPNSIFSHLSSLETVDFGNTTALLTIEDSAFAGSGITSITIPASVTSIGGGVFDACSSLASVTFEDGSQLETLPDDVFYGRSSLETVDFGNTTKLTAIGDSAFNTSGITSLTIPASVTSIGDAVFADCSFLVSVTFEDGSQLQTLPDAVFYGLPSLETVDFGTGSSLTAISDFALFEIKIESISIPDSVTEIGENALASCTDLKSVTFGASSTLESIEQYAFSGCSSLDTITFPTSLLRIQEGAFYGCGNMPSLDLSANTSLNDIGEDAFYYCVEMASVVLPNSVKTIGGGAFAGCTSLTSFSFAYNENLSLGSGVFTGCSENSIEITFDGTKEQLLAADSEHSIYLADGKTTTAPIKKATVTKFVVKYIEVNETAEPVTSTIKSTIYNKDSNGTKITIENYPAHTKNTATICAWNTSATYDGKDYYQAATPTVRDDLTLYAVWGLPTSGSLVGNYIVPNDMTLTGNLIFGENVSTSIDLRGNVLNMGAYGIVGMKDKSNLAGDITLVSTVKNTMHLFTPQEEDAWLWDDTNGTKAIEGGVLYGCSAESVVKSLSITVDGVNFVGNPCTKNTIHGKIVDIRNCVMQGNTGGHLIWVTNATERSSIQSVTFSDNTFSGMIGYINSASTVTDVTAQNNKCGRVFHFLNGMDPKLDNVSVTDNVISMNSAVNFVNALSSVSIILNDVTVKDNDLTSDQEAHQVSVSNTNDVSYIILGGKVDISDMYFPGSDTDSVLTAGNGSNGADHIKGGSAVYVTVNDDSGAKTIVAKDFAKTYYDYLHVIDADKYLLYTANEGDDSKGTVTYVDRIKKQPKSADMTFDLYTDDITDVTYQWYVSPANTAISGETKKTISRTCEFGTVYCKVSFKLYGADGTLNSETVNYTLMILEQPCLENEFTLTLNSDNYTATWKNGTYSGGTKVKIEDPTSANDVGYGQYTCKLTSGTINLTSNAVSIIPTYSYFNIAYAGLTSEFPYNTCSGDADKFSSVMLAVGDNILDCLAYALTREGSPVIPTVHNTEYRWAYYDENDDEVIVGENDVWTVDLVDEVFEFHLHWDHKHDDTTVTSMRLPIGRVMKAGYYFLMDDIVLTADLPISANIVICLNGHVLDVNGYSIIMSNMDTTLTIEDCGTAVHYFEADANGKWVKTDTETENVVEGGYITGGKVSSANPSDDCVFYLDKQRTKVILNGCTLVGNESVLIWVDYNNSSTVLTDTVIVGNTSGVGIYSSASVELYSIVAKENTFQPSIAYKESNVSFICSRAWIKIQNSEISNNHKYKMMLGVENYGSILFEESTIKDNEGGGISNATLQIYGGTITGNKMGGVWAYGNLSLGGDIIISGNDIGNDKKDYNIIGSPHIYLSKDKPFSENAKVGIRGLHIAECDTTTFSWKEHIVCDDPYYFLSSYSDTDKIYINIGYIVKKQPSIMNDITFDLYDEDVVEEEIAKTMYNSYKDVTIQYQWYEYDKKTDGSTVTYEQSVAVKDATSDRLSTVKDGVYYACVATLADGVTIQSDVFCGHAHETKTERDVYEKIFADSLVDTTEEEESYYLVKDEDKYYLDKDLKLDKDLVITARVTLDLNSKVLDLSGHKIHVKGINAKLTINDCGTTEHYFTKTESGKWTYNDDQEVKTEYIVEGGIITNVTDIILDTYEDMEALVLNGGSLVGNDLYINVMKGAFLMSGGQIAYNNNQRNLERSYSDYNYYYPMIYGDDVFRMEGGSIHDNALRASPLIATPFCAFIGGEIVDNLNEIQEKVDYYGYERTVGVVNDWAKNSIIYVGGDFKIVRNSTVFIYKYNDGYTYRRSYNIGISCKNTIQAGPPLTDGADIDILPSAALDDWEGTEESIIVSGAAPGSLKYFTASDTLVYLKEVVNGEDPTKVDILVGMRVNMDNYYRTGGGYFSLTHDNQTISVETGDFDKSLDYLEKDYYFVWYKDGKEIADSNVNTYNPSWGDGMYEAVIVFMKNGEEYSYYYSNYIHVCNGVVYDTVLTEDLIDYYRDYKTGEYKESGELLEGYYFLYRNMSIWDTDLKILINEDVHLALNGKIFNLNGISIVLGPEGRLTIDDNSNNVTYYSTGRKGEYYILTMEGFETNRYTYGGVLFGGSGIYMSGDETTHSTFTMKAGNIAGFSKGIGYAYGTDVASYGEINIEGGTVKGNYIRSGSLISTLGEGVLIKNAIITENCCESALISVFNLKVENSSIIKNTAGDGRKTIEVRANDNTSTFEIGGTTKIVDNVDTSRRNANVGILILDTEEVVIDPFVTIYDPETNLYVGIEVYNLEQSGLARNKDYDSIAFLKDGKNDLKYFVSDDEQYYIGTVERIYIGMVESENDGYMIRRVQIDPSKDNNYTFEIDETCEGTVTYQWYKAKTAKLFYTGTYGYNVFGRTGDAFDYFTTDGAWKYEPQELYDGYEPSYLYFDMRKGDILNFTIYFYNSQFNNEAEVMDEKMQYLYVCDGEKTTPYNMDGKTTFTLYAEKAGRYSISVLNKYHHAEYNKYYYRGAVFSNILLTTGTYTLLHAQTSKTLLVDELVDTSATYICQATLQDGKYNASVYSAPVYLHKCGDTLYDRKIDQHFVDDCEEDAAIQLTDGYYYLNEDIDLGNRWFEIANDQAVHFCMNGYVLDLSNTVKAGIVNHGELFLTGCTDTKHYFTTANDVWTWVEQPTKKTTTVTGGVVYGGKPAIENDGNLFVEGVSFISCATDDDENGGAITSKSQAVVRKSNFYGNTAKKGSAILFHADNELLSIGECEFAYNGSITDSQAVIYAADCDVDITIELCKFHDNKGAYSTDIYFSPTSESKTMAIAETTFENSTASSGKIITINGGDVLLSEVVISGNKAENESILSIMGKAIVTFIDVTVTDNTVGLNAYAIDVNGGESDKATLVLRGKNLFYDNLNGDGKQANLYLKAYEPMQILDLKPGSKIGIVLDGFTGNPVAITEETSMHILDYIVSDDERAVISEYEVSADNYVIRMSVEPHVCEKDEKYYNLLLKEGGALKTGKYFLAEDITLEKDIIIASGEDVVICLNGKVLNLNGHLITNNGGTLRIHDCGKSETNHYFKTDSIPWTLLSAREEGSVAVQNGVIIGGNQPMNAYNPAAIATYNGIGAYNATCTLTIENVSFVGNTTYEGNGVIDIYNADATFDGVNFYGNKANDGLVYCWGNEQNMVTIQNSDFIGNKNSKMISLSYCIVEIENVNILRNFGGGINNTGVKGSLKNVTIQGNTVSNGSPMFTISGTDGLTVTNLTIQDNTGITGDKLMRLILTEDKTITMKNVTVKDNTTGTILQSLFSGTTVFEDCTFTNNTETGMGTSIGNAVVLKNTEISGNTVMEYVYWRNDSPSLTLQGNVTIFDNKTADGKQKNLYFEKTDKKLVTSDLTGGKIGITLNTTITDETELALTGATNGDKLSYFVSDMDGLVLTSVEAETEYTLTGKSFLITAQPSESNGYTVSVNAADKTPFEITYQWYFGEDETQPLEGYTAAQLGVVTKEGKYFVKVSRGTYSVKSNYVETKTVTFDANALENEQGVAPAYVFNLPGRPITLPENKWTYANHIFAGWFTSTELGEGDSVLTTYNVVGSESEKLYAIWTDKKAVTISYKAEDNTFVYDGTSKEFTFTTKDAALDLTKGVTVKYYSGGNPVSKPDVAGKYNVVIERTEDDDYASYYEEIEDAVVITKQKVAVPEKGIAGSKEYTGLTIVSDIVPTEKYKISENNGGIEVGTSYPVVIVLKDTLNYEWAEVTGETPYAEKEGEKLTYYFSITKGQAVITVDTSDIVVKYGTAIFLPQAASNFGDVSCSVEASDLVNVGTYEVIYTVTSTESYKGDIKKLKVVIEKAVVNVPTDVMAGKKVYNGEVQTSDIVPNSDKYTIYTNKGGKDVGVYDVVAKLNDSKNYKWSQGEEVATYTVKFEIYKATVEVPDVTIGGNIVYDGKLHTSTMKATDDYEILTNEGGINVGKYDVVLKLKDSKNYKWSETDEATFTVDFEITRTASKVTVEDMSNIVITYGEIATFPKASATFGEVVTNYKPEELVDVGMYTLKFMVLDSENYTGDEKTVLVIINKTESTVTIHSDVDTITATYGEEIVLPTATATFGEVVCDKTADDLKNAGTYVVTYKVYNNKNFKGDEKKITVVIGKAMVEVPEIAIGGELVYTGKTLVSEMNGTAYYSISENEGGIDVGTYDVVLSLNDAYNYVWSNGSTDTYTVQFKILKGQAVLTVDTETIEVEYGTKVVLPTATTTFGSVNCDKQSSDLVLANEEGYTVTYSVDGNDNYDGDSKSLTVIVKKASYDVSGITFKDVAVLYDGEEHILLIDGELPKGVVVSYQENSGTEVGMYHAVASFAGDKNYNAIPDMEATLSIRSAEIVSDKKTTDVTGTLERDYVKVSAKEGIDSNIMIMTEIIDVEKDSKGSEVETKYKNITDEDAKLKVSEKVGVVFDVSLIKTEGDKQVSLSQIEGVDKMKVKIFVPKDIDRTSITRIIQVNEDGTTSQMAFTESMVDAEGYIEMEVSKVGMIAFIQKNNDGCYKHWIILGLLLIMILFIVLTIVLKDKKVKNILAVVGFVYGILAIVGGAFLLGCEVCIYLYAALCALWGVSIILFNCRSKKKIKTDDEFVGEWL